MAFNVPYDKLTLSLSVLSIKDEDLDLEKLEEIVKGLKENLGESKKELNRRVAEENGIDVEVLINSPNYERLVEGFRMAKVRKFIQDLQKELGLSEKQSWALFAESQGILDS